MSDVGSNAAGGALTYSSRQIRASSDVPPVRQKARALTRLPAHRSLRQVLLHGLGRAHLRLGLGNAELAFSPPLAEEIPALVKLDLKFAESFSIDA